MGKTPAQQNRLKAKQQGMSHESVRDQEAKDIRERLGGRDLARMPHFPLVLGLSPCA